MKTLDFITHYKKYLIFSVILTICSILAILIFGLKLSIDFKGGTILEYKNLTSYPTELAEQPKKIVQLSDSSKYYFDSLSDEKIKEISDKIVELSPNSVRLSSETITSEVGKSQTKSAIYSIICASIGILIYLSISFRSVRVPFRSYEFGIAAIAALVHDALIVLGAFAILGKFIHVEIDLLFITAILTVIGFSVHDTIVVFDRIRENIEISKDNYLQIINRSLNETLLRSIILTFTAVIVLLSMAILGPISIKWFVVALLIGMVSGTYSSIFVASQLLIIIKNKLK